MKVLIFAVALAAAAVALPVDLIEPGRLAFVLNEDDFEDYLDKWLEIEERKWVNATSSDRSSGSTRNGCTFRVNGDLGQPQPVYLHRGDYLQPSGSTATIRLNSGEQVTIACTGPSRVINHPNISSSLSVGTVSCENNALVSASWLRGNGEFGGLVCFNHAYHDERAANTRCYNNNLVIRVGFIVNNLFYPLYWSCFDQQRLEVLFVWYEQTPRNAVHQSGVHRPSWLQGSFFPSSISVNTLYTQNNQRATLIDLLGQDLADKYLTSTQFLARGHLAAKTDFVFATAQRATFYFYNAAPQWQPFNAGNWNSLEQNLRERIAEAGYNTVIYTGTFGVTQLRDRNDRLVDIYLHRDRNNNPQLPVPLYFYKVAYDASRGQATAFVSINNPYYTLNEARALQFCTDRCRNNGAFSWLKWQPDQVDIGYSFCCTLADFRRVIPHLPAFSANGLLA